ncbi:pumilio homolog 6, chloroplastic-like [Pyrus x bretschneideri]|uniref:pumilio homolog 6, chloroplastic-like n=1 Tax=Pyrus x bretschneideri TaxID=225117 RepID=UPI00202F0ACF|nr:pumilio homolog 6, chloroplastic-like [Pyrus x bretschneideri]
MLFSDSMATESPIRMSETSAKWAPHKKTAMAAEELKLLLRGHKFKSSRQDISPNRSGSAPPSMEGSFLAINDLLSQQDTSMNGSLASLSSVIERCETEEQLRADPAYLAYYCANVNLNPRLPRPLISWENRRLARHIGSFSQNWGPEDCSGNFLLHVSQGSLPTHKEESEDDQSSQHVSNDWVDRTSEVWSGEGAASFIDHQHQNASDLIQEDFEGSAPPVPNHSHTLGNGIPEEFIDHSSDSSSLHDPVINATTTIRPSVGADTADATELSPNDNSSPTSVSRSTAVNDACVAVIEPEMKALNISDLIENQKKHEQWERSCQNHFLQQQAQQQNNFCQVQSGKKQITSQGTDSTYISMDQHLHNTSKFAADVQPVLQTSGFTPPLYATAAAYVNSANPYYSNIQGPGFLPPQYVGGYMNPTAFSPYIGGYHPPVAVPVVVDGTVGPSLNARTSGVATAGILSPGADMQHSSKFYGQLGYPLQSSFSESMYMQYHQRPFVESYGVPSQFDPSASRGGVDSKKVSSHGTYLDEHKSQHQRIGNMGNLNPQRGGSVTSNYFGSAPNVGILMQYPTPPLTSPVSPVPPIGSGRNTGLYAWPGHRGFESYDDPKIYNFLEELKSGKGRRFELSDITGHIVEFSADQHGSRFIQQKLENCSVEEKASVFKEVVPHASKLMTDVFGNYVIQKFLEYGTPQQRKELANQLLGQILPLSLQMYGCRVIQKALEVIELEQKVQLVHELDGHILRCVRDQNGNHVIQKCIESIPTEKIGFIISAFRGQVPTLSIHPYGCRVIQRVLEHCTDELQCQFIVDEILESVAGLAQDQYGNYVTQHVLERGKPNERRKIINKLSGHFVPLSQHKFASNVVEKCLEYGGAAERELLISEIVGHNEGNDNLLVMMKDQYANYVVQKTLEICTDSQRVLLINRIRGHTNTLKKYTYGKHIVARFEQLFGEENLS